MARRQKEIIMPHLNDCGGDLTRKWYVEYSIRNPQSGKMERIRVYDGINLFSTRQERFDFSQKIIKQFSEQIKEGSISYQEFVEYEDLLLYDGEGSFTRKRKAKAGNIKIYLSDFLQLKKLEVNKKSFETYQSKLRLFCLYAEKNSLINKPVTQYTNEIITDFLRDLVSRKKLSRKSIEKYEQILHSFFKYLNRKKVVPENPVCDIPKIGIVKDEAPAAIPAYMRTMFKKEIEPRDPQLWMFICFIYYMAIRPGQELRLMRLNQIDYDARKIVIPNYVSKNSDTEAVDIPDQLFELMVKKWQLHTYSQELYVFGKYFEPGEKHLSVNDMSKRFNKFRDKLKLPVSIKLYSWKHSGAQELAAQGASIYELQRHLRHRDLTTTEMYLKKRIGQRSNMIKHNFPSI
ncbi:MAG: site-specific integrase [Tannerella sp.]|nr:site-specific integrase [Tannerella sp.]